MSYHDQLNRCLREAQQYPRFTLHGQGSTMPPGTVEIFLADGFSVVRGGITFNLVDAMEAALSAAAEIRRKASGQPVG